MKFKKWLRSVRAKKVGLALIIASFLTITIGLSRAATNFYSLEPENASISGNVSIKSDVVASGGKYIEFGATSTQSGSGTTNTSPTSETIIKGATYYLDCDGSDSNDGKSQTSAWKSLAKASSASLNPGDGILLKRGCSWSENLTAKWPGSASSPVVVGAYGNGAAPIITRNTNGANINVTGSYIVIQDLNLTAIAPSKISGTICDESPVGNIQGVAFESGATNNTLKNSTISNMYAGVYLKTGATNNKIINNTLTKNNMMSPLDTSSDNDAGAFGVLIWGSDNEIAYNVISDSNACSYDYELDGAAIEIFGGSSTPTVNNVIHHNKAINTNAFTELGKSSSGAIPNNNTFAYNTYYASGISNAIFMVTRGDTGNYGPINGTKVFNNTAYMVGTNKNGLYCGSCSSTALTFKNNIIATNNNTPIPSNLGSGVSNNIGWVVGSSNNDPKFVNGPGQDFRLQAGSIASNKGSNEFLDRAYAKTDFDSKAVPIGETVDIGAYEYGTVAISGQNSRISSWLKEIGDKVASFARTLSVIISKAAISISNSFKSLTIDILGVFKTKKVEAIQSNGSVVIAAVGDMNPDNNTSTTSASGKNASAITAGLANGSIDAFFGLGDFQYQQGTCSTLVNSWGKLWGSALPKTYHIAGPTHDSASATEELGYRQYFNGECPGSSTKSAAVQAKGTSIGPFDFYSYDIGNWHFVALPTATWRYNTTKANAITAELDTDLAKAKAAGKHLAALYHDPYFTSKTSSHDREYKVKPWIDVLDKYNVRLSLSGSQHNYERSCPVLKDDSCTAENGRGTTAFNVSTGGIGLRTFATNPTYIIKKFSDTHGWLKLTLNTDGSFSWVYNPVNGASTDSGSRPALNGAGTTIPPTTDTIPPTVSIANPSANATVSSTVSINTNTTDNSGYIKKVELFIDSSTTPTQTITTSPYNFSLDTKLLPNGSHIIKINSHDNAGNIGTTSININISNTTCQAITADYGTVSFPLSVSSSGKYRVWSRIKATDNTNNSYFLVIDNQCPVNVSDKTNSPGAWTWTNTKDGGSTPIEIDLTTGSHIIKLVGREPGVQLDKVLFVADTGCVPNGIGDNCSTTPDSTAPTINITSPGINQAIKGSLNITVDAKDNVSVSKVEYYLDEIANVPFSASNSSPFSTTWDSTKTSAGPHLLRAIAYDASGNKSSESSVSIIILDQVPPVVAIESPTGGNLSGLVNVKVNATDNTKLARVELKLDNNVIAKLITFPYTYSWDTKTATNSTHQLVAIAIDSDNNTTTSIPISVNVQNDSVYPSTPINLKADNLSTSSVRISWDNSSDNAAIAGYNIYKGGQFLKTIETTEYVDANLTPNTTYTYSVSAVDVSNNESTISSVLNVKTLSLTTTKVPDAPTNLRVNIDSSTKLSISWSAGANNPSGTKYLVQRNGFIIAQTTSTSYQDMRINPGNTYVYVIFAVNKENVYSKASEEISYNAPRADDTQTPSPPTNLSASVSAALISLSWGAALDNTGVAEYRVYREDKLLGKTTNLSFGDATIKENTTYSYFIVAIDQNGNVSEKSNTITIKSIETNPKLSMQVVADTYVQKDKANKNFGNEKSIKVDKRPTQKLLLKMQVSGTSGKVITGAKLRLYANNGSTRTGGELWTINNSQWEENKVTWNNTPQFNGESIYKLGKVARKSYVDIDLSKIIKGDGTYSIGLTSFSSDAAHYNSREASSKTPELIITTN